MRIFSYLSAIFKIKVLLKVIKLIENWPTYILDFCKINKNRKKYVVYILSDKGIKYKMRAGTTDIDALHEIWVHNFYTPKSFEIHKDDLVIDVGAHIGVFSVFASHFARKGNIYAFEPILENYIMLKENIAINRIQNINPINMAISDKSGEKEMYLNDFNTGAHSFSGRSNKSRMAIVQAISLEDFVKQNHIEQIDFLKMDCEGAEYEILYNCPDRIFRMIKKISMEHHHFGDNMNVFALARFLKEKGLRVEISTQRYRQMLYAKNNLS